MATTRTTRLLMKTLTKLSGADGALDERFAATYRIGGERFDRRLVFTRKQLQERGIQPGDPKVVLVKEPFNGEEPPPD